MSCIAPGGTDRYTSRSPSRVDLGLGVDDRLRQVAPVVGARDDEAQPLREPVPVLVELTAPVLLQGVTDVLRGTRRRSRASAGPIR